MLWKTSTEVLLATTSRAIQANGPQPPGKWPAGSRVLPKGPCHTRNTTESKFATAIVKCYSHSKTLRRGLRIGRVQRAYPERPQRYRVSRNQNNLQVSQGIARYRALPHPKIALSQPSGEGGKGYRSSSCTLEGIELYKGFAEIVSPIAV